MNSVLQLKRLIIMAALVRTGNYVHIVIPITQDTRGRQYRFLHVLMNVHRYIFVKCNK